ncbi:hypothetical protein [Shewanella aegiceratis]|uniref:hypothetical protein n=1 Tax=Shewanella aegiceratis TaxID=2864203 RepID=UPI001C658033|nr:hypothetical protein [Shewanella aegiceratis]QYJ80889.1 hypothetical protein K0H80_11105 [Shewanella aegiceratis]
MKKEDGNPHSPIWLIGDSEPHKLASILEFPLDSRHPTRHNIWTPILDQIQEVVFTQKLNRLSQNAFYIRNAVSNSELKKNLTSSSKNLDREINELNELFNRYKPKLIFSFGSFSFEFCRRALNETVKHAPSYWSVERLNNEFTARIASTTSLIPLLHAVIARGQFMLCHQTFSGNTGNYFSHTGSLLAERILYECGDRSDVWMHNANK